MNDFFSTISELGSQEIVSGNTPFLLQDPKNVWFVESGRIELFSVHAGESGPVGIRFHFLTLEPGDIFLGMDLARYGNGRGFLAVGLVNTHLRRMSLEQCLEKFAESPLLDVFLGKLEKWIHELSRAMSRDHHYRAQLLIQAGARNLTLNGQSFRPREGLLWLKNSHGTMLFLGMEPVPDCLLLPLSSHAWMECLGPVEAEIIDAREAVRSPEFVEGLQTFFALLLNCETMNRQLEEVDQFNRLRDRAASGTRAGTQALRDLASVVDSEQTSVPIHSDDPLFQACQMIGEMLNQKIVLPAEPHKKGKYPLRAIAKASKMRLRRITLDGEWWSKESVLMLGFIREKNAPVILKLRAENGSCFIDPATGIKTPINQANAAQFAGDAFIFYPSFGDQLLGLKSVMKFGLSRVKSDLIFLISLGLISGLLSLLIPIGMAVVVDENIPEASLDNLIYIIIGLIVACLVMGVLDFTRGVALLRVEGKMDATIQAALMDRLLKLPLSFFRKYSSGDLAERANGIMQIRQIASEMVASTILTNIFGLFNLGLLFYYSPILAAVACGAMLICLVVTLAAFSRQVVYQREITAIQGRLSSLVLQFLGGITKLRVAAAEILAYSTWAREFSRQKKIAVRSRAVTNFLATFNSVFPILSSAALFTSIAYYFNDQKLSPGQFVGFTAAFAGFSNSILTCTLAVIGGLNAIPLMERMKPILTAPLESDAGKLTASELVGAVEVTGVSFRYSREGALVLKNVSLSIAPGEFVAIVGPSGSGKSTLLRLLLGFDLPETGAIHFDGQNLADLDLPSVRRQIGIVLQSSKLITGDVLFNIIGSLPLTIEDAWEAARIAGLEQFILDLPMGMHTMVNSGTAVFSGGQQQRLMIARSVASKPKLLFFDEATSALDNRTQAVVSESLERLQSTRIVIAHRLSTVKNADRLIVMEAGKIVQTGTYEELIAQPGLFQELASRQLLENEPI